jgi:hypothetical protein
MDRSGRVHRPKARESDVSRFLAPLCLAVTTTYLRRPDRQEDRSWAKVAEALGL